MNAQRSAASWSRLCRSLAARRSTRTQAELAIVWQRNPSMAVAWQAAMLANGKRKLLTVNQAKLDKSGETIGVMTAGLTMSPASEAAPFIAGYNACAGSTAACRSACVGNATGQAYLSSKTPFDGHLLARLGRSVLHR